MTDFQKICRACRTKKINLLNMFVNEVESEPSLGYKYAFCTQLEIKDNDMMPQCICYACAKQLEIGYSFRVKCLETEMKLRALLPVIEKQMKETDQDQTNEDEEELSQPENCSNQDNAESMTVEYIYESFQDASSPHEKEDSKLSSPPKSGKVKTDLDANFTITEKSRAFQCDECEKSFYTETVRELHKKLHSKHRKPGLRKSFKNDNWELEQMRQIRTILQRDRSFEIGSTDGCVGRFKGRSLCSVCGKKFDSSVLLRAHMLAHQGANQRKNLPI